MPSRELQQNSQDTRVSPTWEATPWEAQERVVMEMTSDEKPLELSDEHVIQLQESESLRRVR